MTHEMKLLAAPFAAMRSGTKTIEARLYDAKRRQIQPGDTIIFRCLPELQEKITRRVVELLPFPTFAELFRAFPAADFGGESVAALETQIYQIYSRAAEAQDGAVGIRLEEVWNYFSSCNFSSNRAARP